MALRESQKALGMAKSLPFQGRGLHGVFILAPLLNLERLIDSRNIPCFIGLDTSGSHRQPQNQRS